MASQLPVVGVLAGHFADAHAPAPGAAGGADEATVTLVKRICAGDNGAANVLIRRYMPVLRRWAHGKLPSAARGLDETDDLVQTTLMRAIDNAAGLRLDNTGSFLAYLRQILINQVRDAIRKHKRQTERGMATVELGEHDAADPTDQIEQFVELQAYEKALGMLSKRHQELIIMRFEFGLSYAEIASDVGVSVDGVRMAISRALLKLTEALAQSA